MNVVIAGSRNLLFKTEDIDRWVAMSGFEVTAVICGGAAGIDSLGAHWAFQKGIQVRPFHAEWAKYGRKAGVIRNASMANAADALILVWDGESRGSLNMNAEMIKQAKPVFEVLVCRFFTKEERLKREEALGWSGPL